MTEKEKLDSVRRSINATLDEIEHAPDCWQQLGDIVEAKQIIERIERRLASQQPINTIKPGD